MLEGYRHGHVPHSAPHGAVRLRTRVCGCVQRWRRRIPPRFAPSSFTVTAAKPGRSGLYPMASLQGQDELDLATPTDQVMICGLAHPDRPGHDLRLGALRLATYSRLSIWRHSLC